MSADADAAAASENGKNLVGRNKIHAQSLAKASGNASTKGVWNGGSKMEDGLPSYMRERKLSEYPQSVVGTPLFDNYKLLFGKNVDGSRNKDFEQLDLNAKWPLYRAYIKLFSAMRDFMSAARSEEDQ